MTMKRLNILALILGILCTGIPILAAQPTIHRATLTRSEAFRVEIQNWSQGAVSVSTDNGTTWQRIASVVVPNPSMLHEVADGEFTASDWAPIGAIAATAVNAIHVKVDHAGPHATLFSLLPRELIVSSNIITSYLSQTSSIFLDQAGGAGVMGGQWAPRVGDPIFLSSTANPTLQPWPLHRAPGIGDIITVISQVPSDNQWMIMLENKPSGSVTYHRGETEPILLATVIKAFQGSGNFQGGVFQSVGRIRANHPGVIDISSSPYGKTGGIQIVPQYHSREKNLAYVYKSPVYMLIAPLNPDDYLEGTPPLFNGTIRPGQLVEAKIHGVWQPFPEASGRQFEAFKDVEAIRIIGD